MSRNLRPYKDENNSRHRMKRESMRRQPKDETYNKLSRIKDEIARLAKEHDNKNEDLTGAVEKLEDWLND